ncbi:APC family permease [Aquipuribacter nitratireducens]|uniref:APC family permease n=1 Tax=Aquipuribacter nitratireducens TaxID=650104 RepID=A0ABW0GV40_9MICO
MAAEPGDGNARTTDVAGEETQGELRRTVGPTAFALYGAGTILGAGIFVLIGEIAGRAGYWTPIAFVVAAFVAGVNGMVYAELGTRQPKAGGPAAYVREALRRRWLAVIIAWLIVATGVVSSATIASGFSGYLVAFIDMPEWIPRAVLILVLAAVAAGGVEQSTWFMAVTATAGVIGLLFVWWAGFLSGQADPGRLVSEAGGLADAALATGVLSAVFLAIYAFIGFEDMSHVAEEVKRPGFSLPFGIGAAIGVCAVLYTVTAVAALSVLDPDALGGATAPLVEVVAATGIPTWPVTVLSLVIISSGVLAQLIMGSRVIYSLGRPDGGAAGDVQGAPGWLAAVNERTGTPVRATFACALVAVALALFLPLATLAAITTYVLLVVFAFANVSLIVLERRRPDAPFDLPAWVPWVGLVLTLALLVGQPFVGG